jgi:hypothetical protein
MAIFWSNPTNSVVEVCDPKNNWIMNVTTDEENGFYVGKISFGSELLVFRDYCERNWERMKIWRMSNPPTLLHDRTCEYRELTMEKVDEQFVVASSQPGPLLCILFILKLSKCLQV